MSEIELMGWIYALALVIAGGSALTGIAFSIYKLAELECGPNSDMPHRIRKLNE